MNWIVRRHFDMSFDELLSSAAVRFYRWHFLDCRHWSIKVQFNDYVFLYNRKGEREKEEEWGREKEIAKYSKIFWSGNVQWMKNSFCSGIYCSRTIDTHRALRDALFRASTKWNRLSDSGNSRTASLQRW